MHFAENQNFREALCSKCVDCAPPPLAIAYERIKENFWKALGQTPSNFLLVCINKETMFNFCQKELAPLADTIDKTNNFPELREVWKKMGDLGMLGATASSEYGGSDMGYFAHCILVEEIARVSASISLSYGAHSNLCVNQLNRNGSEEQKEKVCEMKVKR